MNNMNQSKTNSTSKTTNRTTRRPMRHAGSSRMVKSNTLRKRMVKSNVSSISKTSRRRMVNHGHKRVARSSRRPHHFHPHGISAPSSASSKENRRRFGMSSSEKETGIKSYGLSTINNYNQNQNIRIDVILKDLPLE